MVKIPNWGRSKDNPDEVRWDYLANRKKTGIAVIVSRHDNTPSSFWKTELLKFNKKKVLSYRKTKAMAKEQALKFMRANTQL